MKLINKLLQKLSVILYNSLQRSSQVNIKNAKNISESSILENVYLYGDISIGKYASLTRGVHCTGKVVIGDYSSISGPNTDLTSMINFIKIGKFCSVARNVSFQEYYHHTSRLSTFKINEKLFESKNHSDIVSKGEIVIGNDVWIGTHCVILSGVKIGNGAVIGANSVVNKDVPPYAVVAGSPAKIINYRFDEKVIEKIEELKWWDWPLEKIKENRHLFNKKIDLENLTK